MVRNGTKLSSLPQIPTPTLPPPPSEVSASPASQIQAFNAGKLLWGAGEQPAHCTVTGMACAVCIEGEIAFPGVLCLSPVCWGLLAVPGEEGKGLFPSPRGVEVPVPVVQPALRLAGKEGTWLCFQMGLF